MGWRARCGLTTYRRATRVGCKPQIRGLPPPYQRSLKFLTGGDKLHIQRDLSMAEPTITCPSCQAEIKLTDSLAAPLIASMKAEFSRQLATKDAAVAKREAAIKEQEEALSIAQATVDAQVGERLAVERTRLEAEVAARDKGLREREDALSKARSAVDTEIAERLKVERLQIAETAARNARLAVSTDLEDKAREIAELNGVLKERESKLAEAQQAQAEVVRKQRELEDAKRELDLTIEKRVGESLGTIRDQARKEAEDQLRLKVSEKEQTIASMQKQIEELRKRAEQGSQQLQGEVQELELELLLGAAFPKDLIEPVPKGEHGGDVLQRIIGPLNQPCGTILWESKRTKNWSDSWLPKLRDDQRDAKAEVAALLSHALPDGVDHFDRIDGVWVAHPRVVIPMAMVLRQLIIDVSMARQAGEGQQTKMEMVYEYLTGPRFRHRVEAIVEAFTSMQEDLDRERKVIIKQWAKREEQIRRVVEATMGMYGDFQGIAGKTMQEIEGLGLAVLEDKNVPDHTP